MLSSVTAFARPAALTHRILGLVLCVTAAACGGHGTSDLVPNPDPPPTPAAAAASERAELRAQLAAHRQLEIARLHAYGQAGLFPRNTTVAPTGHFFRDADGRLCAVANLVHQDGRDDLVDAVVRTKNDLVVADVHDGALYDWVLASGLTQEELARIQRPAPRIRPSLSPTPKPAVAHPAPKPTPAPVAALPTEDDMRAQLQAQLAVIEKQLGDDTEASLDTAVSRMLAARGG
jgi:hypothetical protein